MVVAPSTETRDPGGSHAGRPDKGRPRPSAVVQTRSFTFAEPPDEMVLESGQTLGPITLAYETYGKLNRDRSNAVLVSHALSGDAHAAGWHEGDKDPGWWDGMIGPGQGLRHGPLLRDLLRTSSADARGAPGPSSINPATRQALRPRLPRHHRSRTWSTPSAA